MGLVVSTENPQALLDALYRERFGPEARAPQVHSPEQEAADDGSQ